VPGIVEFESLTSALKLGFQVYDKTPTGYLVKTMTPKGWALAIVTLTKEGGKMAKTL
jgi:hypothetical protein